MVNVIFSILVIPPTPMVETDQDKFDFASKTHGISLQLPQNARSVENIATNQSNAQIKGSQLLLAPQFGGHDRRLSIPVVLIRGGDKIDNKFSSNDNVYLENIYKAASMTSLGNFGAVDPLPIIKNKEGKW